MKLRAGWVPLVALALGALVVLVIVGGGLKRSVALAAPASHASSLAFVHGNFWLLPSTGGPAPTACGLDWLGPDQTVLRTVRRYTPDTS